MAFCGKCGQQLNEGARFCRSCGTPTVHQATTPRVPTSPATSYKSGSSPRLLAGLAVIVLLVCGGGVFAWQSGLFKRASATIVEPRESGTIDEIASWKAAYTDQFLSDPQTLFLTGTANVRDYPSSNETIVLRSLPEGKEINGQLVAGREAGQKWLKLDEGGYIWDGNIGSWAIIYPAGMSGLFVGRPRPDFLGHLSEQGTYGQSAEYCETYDSLDGRFSVMFENNVATSFLTSNPQLMTQKGVRVGMDVAGLRQAYGEALVSEPNTYGGTDYFFWQSPERGLRFYVGDSETIESIWSGTQSIRYVEGCL